LSAAELVTVTVDDRAIQVPKGTGIVETALAGGIEIPVFCYEPRLGPAIGACRMCLCEVEGMPKPMAACTMTAQDGMVVRTAQTSSKAAEAQHGILEFILINHPLDCPVCDKGGECPLQDLTFRYGPGSTRMHFPKRTFDKPIPISPLIALDRERCILCYRCTRFSEGIAEDAQLVSENRGAQSVITTFEGEPYRAPFSGNVTELCPVGALTSTEYRFEARPWEIQNVPSVCGLCPVGCNIMATTREGKVKRVLSRNHPEVDEGWLCDKGRDTFPHLRATDRIAHPFRRIRRRGLEPIPWEEAIDEAERMLRAAQGHILVALSGSETCEQAYALAKLLRQGLGSHSAMLPEETSDALDAYRAPLSAIREAELVVVLGDEPVVERAPLVDLWLKAARRNGAEILTVGAAGSIQAAPGDSANALRRLARDRDDLGERLRTVERAILIWSGPGGHGGVTLAALAHELGFADRPGCGAFHLPATPNGRGVAEAWAAAADADAANPQPVKLLVVSGDEAAADPNVRALAEHADAVIATTMFHGLAVGWADLVLPATSYLEREGTLVNLEGRLQRLRPAANPPGPDELAWLARLGERFGVGLSPYATHVFDELAAKAYGGIRFSDVGERAALPPRTAARDITVPATPEAGTVGGGPLQLVRYRALFSGPAVERVRALQFQRPAAEVELSPEDASVRGIAGGDRVRVSSNGTSVELRAVLDHRLKTGVVRAAEEHVRALRAGVEVTRSSGNRSRQAEVSG
jgi:NADH-quinone oxidoreductase subunit G